MGSSIAPKMFPSAGGFGKSQTNIASQVQTPDQATNPTEAQSQVLPNQSNQPVAAQNAPDNSTDPTMGAGENAQMLDQLRRLRAQNNSGPMPFYG